MMDRRVFLAGLASLPVMGCAAPKVETHRKIMAITMDDFNLGFDIRLSPLDRNRAILDAFDAVGHKAAGFVTGRFTESEPGDQVVQSWLDGGHLIGNHTYVHAHANEVETSEYVSDILKNKEFLSKYPGVSNYFRFPFLDDGQDAAQQTELFAALDDMDLINAPVSFDTVDWYTTDRLEKRLRAEPEADLTPYRDYYVTMCRKLAAHWDAVAQALGYVSLPILTLMHHNILNGLFLKDVLLALKSDGWDFVDAAEALAFPEYHAQPPEPTEGRNWLTLQAKAKGIEIPPYPREYFQFGGKTMDALGL